MESREFSLGAILSVVLGRTLLRHTDEERARFELPAEPQDLVVFMKGKTFKEHSLQVRDECRTSLIEQFPQLPRFDNGNTALDAIIRNEPDREKRQKIIDKWLAEQVLLYGEKLSVRPI